MFDTRRDDREFDESAATLLIRFEDDDLDHDYGEGREVSIWRTPAGDYYWKQRVQHIDADGPRHCAGWISEVKVRDELTTLGAGQVLVEHFPGSWQARCFSKHGTVDLDELGLEPGPLYRGANLVLTLPASAYDDARLLYRSEVGVFIAVAADTPRPEEGGAEELDEDSDITLLEPGEALEEALRAGASRDLLARYWPQELEATLLDELGLDSWAALESDDGSRTLLARCERCYGYVDQVQDREGWIVSEELHRLDEARFVRVRLRVEREGRELEVLRRVDALIAAYAMQGADEAILRAIFVDDATWRDAAEQLGQPLFA
jgi:hypothetical protein